MSLRSGPPSTGRSTAAASVASGASAQSDWTPDDPLLTWAATQRTRRRGRRASKLPKRRTVVEEEVARVAPHPVSEETRLWEAHPKVDKRGTHRWGKSVDEQAAIVAEIGRAVLEGRRQDGYTWQRFDKLTAKAKLTDTTTPGPGHYGAGASGVGRQTLSHRRSLPSFTMNPKAKAKGRFTTVSSKGTVRVKVPAKHLTGGKASRKPPSLPAPRSTLGTGLPTSTYRRAPSYSMSSRRRPRPKSPDLNTNNPPVTSSVGRQFVSHKASASSAAFSRAPRAKTPELTFDPNPFSYKPKHSFLQRTAPTAVLAGLNKPEREPLPYDAAVGTYNLQGSIGKQSVAGLRTQPAVSFGTQYNIPSVEILTFGSAQERKQPAALRPVKTLPRDRLRETMARTVTFKT